MADNLPDQGEPNILLYCLNRIDEGRANGRTINASYLAVYKHFILEFVTPNLNDPAVVVVEHGPKGPVYCTQFNVEKYYELCVVNLGGGKPNSKAKLSALSKIRQLIELPGSSKLVWTGLIDEAIVQQQANNRTNANAKYAGSDPHRGLKDKLPKAQVAEIIHAIRTCSTDSYSLLFVYLWGINAGIRGSSVRKLLYSDLNISYGYGPEDDAPYNKTILLVLRKGEVHKDRHISDKQVGAQRHVDWRNDCIFALGVLLIMQLREWDDNINFYHEDKNQRASWWDLALIDFETYSEQASAMRTVLNTLDIDAIKLTHQRLQAMQHAGSSGLTPWQMSTMTKHILDKLTSAYAPECEEETLKVMSGFKKSEYRFIPNERLQLPRPIEWYVNQLIPKYSVYLEQMNSPTGDTSSLCRKFLKEIIPYVCETVLKAGIHFVRSYPLHEFSSELMVSSVIINVL